MPELGTWWKATDFEAAAKLFRIRILIWNIEQVNIAQQVQEFAHPEGSLTIFIICRGMENAQFHPCFPVPNLPPRWKAHTLRYVSSVIDYIDAVEVSSPTDRT